MTKTLKQVGVFTPLSTKSTRGRAETSAVLLKRLSAPWIAQALDPHLIDTENGMSAMNVLSFDLDIH